MKKLKVTTSIMVIALVTLSAMSCKDAKKEGHHSGMESEEGHHHDTKEEGHIDKSSGMMDQGQKTSKSTNIVADYLQLKNALVADDNDAAKKAGAELLATFSSFDASTYSSEQKEELIDIVEDAKEHAEHISESPIHHQREHFETLSQDVLDFVTITGTDQTLYKDFCPMYNDNKGGMWLSETKEIKNPYYGSKMLNCGSIQKEIN